MFIWYVTRLNQENSQLRIRKHRIIDDLLCINNDQVCGFGYGRNLSLTSDDAVLKAHCLDLDLDIVHDKIECKLFDKRDAFGFSVVNFPDLW